MVVRTEKPKGIISKILEVSISPEKMEKPIEIRNEKTQLFLNIFFIILLSLILLGGAYYLTQNWLIAVIMVPLLILVITIFRKVKHMSLSKAVGTAAVLILVLLLGVIAWYLTIIALIALLWYAGKGSS
ncbi:hypothetical protein H0N98_01475 [Candidatus Micrarchaeota archaeon]|nr:hypothetical protein [Candidatus Micrarchaeota archaeon]